MKQKVGHPGAVPAAAGNPQELALRDRALEVVSFWRGVGKDGWFTQDDDVDRRFRDQFYDLHFAAARRELEHWLENPDTALALILLLDQFPRNVFRHTAHMFATDPLACHYARRIIDSGCVDRVDPELRLFICLPFVHSESLMDQDYALNLYQRHARDSLDWARHHRSIIVRFGRFPHRNASLGRTTTPEEQVFLNEGGFTG